ncbi:MAG: hypothetical protein ACR2IP_07555 [Solirubrobacteraceae bacterium]
MTAARLEGAADVLIHLEPEDRVRPGEELLPPRSDQLGEPWAGGAGDPPTGPSTSD